MLTKYLKLNGWRSVTKEIKLDNIFKTPFETRCLMFDIQIISSYLLRVVPAISRISSFKYHAQLVF